MLLVLHEMSASFFADQSECQHTVERGIEAFILGLPALTSSVLRYEEPATCEFGCRRGKPLVVDSQSELASEPVLAKCARFRI